MGGGPDADVEQHHRAAFLSTGANLLHNLFFLGPQQQPVIAAINNIASVGVFPSYREPFGLVFIEALACGCPVIGCRSGGPVDIIGDNKDLGALVEDTKNLADDKTALVQSVAQQVQLAVEQRWREKNSDKCVKHAVSNFSTAAQVKLMMQTFEQWKQQPNTQAAAACCCSCSCNGLMVATVVVAAVSAAAFLFWKRRSGAGGAKL